MKSTLTAFCTLFFVASLPASAQITINALPFPVGSGEYAQSNTDNEDGANTSAIEALIAQSGADQTYDLTAIDFEDLFTGTYTIAIGPTGPGADTEPLDQATKTLILPFVQEEGGDVYEGIVYDYIRETDDAAYNMGGYFEGTLNGGPVSFISVREPDGDREFVFPMTMGAMWTSEFVESTTFGSTTFESEFEKEYEVDGWGTMLLPNVEGAIEVLRVKETTTQFVSGFPLTSICYDLRANGPFAATFCEGDILKSPTAYVTVLDVGATDAESDAAPTALRLESVYPNPARDRVTVSYALPTAGEVELVVYDVLGRPVRTAVRSVRPAGTHTESVVTEGLTSGRYVLRLLSAGASQTRAFSVVR